MRMKLNFILLIFLFIGLLSAEVMACDRQERDRAEHYAQQAGNRLVDSFGGGQDIRVQLRSCRFNTYSKTFITEINVSWNGALFRSNNYSLFGELTMNANGGNARFAESWASQSVKDLRFWGAVSEGLIALGALGHESTNPALSTATGNAAQIYASTTCYQPVDMWLRYQTLSGNWRIGKWTVSPGNGVYLASSNQRITTRSNTLFFYAESGNSRWNGPHNFSYDGRTLRMRQIERSDNTVKRINLNCT